MNLFFSILGQVLNDQTTHNSSFKLCYFLSNNLNKLLILTKMNTNIQKYYFCSMVNGVIINFDSSFLGSTNVQTFPHRLLQDPATFRLTTCRQRMTSHVALSLGRLFHYVQNSFATFKRLNDRLRRRGPLRNRNDRQGHLEHNFKLFESYFI